MLKTFFWKKNWYEKMVMNYWISAYTSDNVLKVFDSFFNWVSKRESGKEKESIVVIAIGINDCSFNRVDNQARVWEIRFRKNIESLIYKCKSNSLVKEVVFIGNINVDEGRINDNEGDNLFYNKEIEKYNKILQDQCLDNKIKYIDVFWIMEMEDLEDWLHPTTKWHEKIFERVKEYLDKDIKYPETQTGM